MTHFRYFLLLSLVTVGVWAQPAPNRETRVSQMAPEQRRAELRSVLKAPSEREAQDKEPAVEHSPANRRLSEQERSELRQQLRQQRPVVSQDSW